MARKAIKKHVENIDFFAAYMVYYEPVARLDDADGGCVTSFLMDWFPRKAMWAGLGSVKANKASFKKLFKWMGETGRVENETVA